MVETEPRLIGLCGNWGVPSQALGVRGASSPPRTYDGKPNCNGYTHHCCRGVRDRQDMTTGSHRHGRTQAEAVPGPLRRALRTLLVSERLDR